MTSSSAADLLIELGTEELPPKALRKLSDAFAAGVDAGLKENRLDCGAAQAYASPRRLAVIVAAVPAAQVDRLVTQKGPPVSIGLDASGAPTKAGLAFAKKCGVEFDALTRESSKAGEWLVYTASETGKSAIELVPQIVSKALDALPIPRRMRWGDNDAEFVRPVHWLILLHGKDVIPGKILGVDAGRTSRGHRFMCTQELRLAAASDYVQTLEKQGFVVADFAARRKIVVAAVTAAAAGAGGTAVADDALFDEVTALTEWPVPVTGSFDQAFLALPKEVIVQTLTSHQRYFPLVDNEGALLPVFITLANIASKEPERVRDGNERVIRPRLADAAFFWKTDQQTPLSHRAETLKNVVYQKGLGTLHEKSMRVAALAGLLAEQTGADKDLLTRAAVLAKCDLVTGMVGEFPELQGVMGAYYAASSDEPEEVAQAIGEQYLPAFAGDALPQSLTGQVLGIADRLDTLAGIFLLGKKPTGNRDPFGLRRASLGVVRILVEMKLDIDLREAVAAAAVQQPVSTEDRIANRDALYDYILERMRGYIIDNDNGFTTDMFDAVKAREPASLLDFHARLAAVAAFLQMDEAVSLAAANKRTANILRKAKVADTPGETSGVDPALLQDTEERALYAAVQAAREEVAPYITARNYASALQRLAALRTPVDAFFDGVMVMAEDASLRANRLALLHDLRALFLGVADLSKISASQE